MIEPHVYQALAEVVGADFISEDITIRQAYSKDPCPPVVVRKLDKDPLTIPDLIVLPSSTEEVQGVLRIANRYDIKVIPIGSGDNMTGNAIPIMHRTMILDLKRMDKILEIDEENKCFRIQPYVSIARVQAEAMKRGLWNGGTPCAPSSNTILSNMMFVGGMYQSAMAYGFGVRSLHSITVVLPNGDILRTGSHGIFEGNPAFWYGPGPDLRCLWEMASMGALGVVTEAIVKLHTWVGGEWPIEEVYGHPPLPKNHRIYWFKFAKAEDAAQAGREISYSSIGTHLNIPINSVSAMQSQSHQDISRKMFDEGYFEPHWMYIMLTGFSPRRLDYEEKVLMDIIEETGGEPLGEDQTKLMECYHMDAFRSGDFVRWVRDGIYTITGMCRIPVEDRVKSQEGSQRTVQKFEHVNFDEGWPWAYCYERGHFWLSEQDLFGDQYRDSRRVKAMLVDYLRGIVDNAMGYTMLAEPFPSWKGTQIGPNFHLLLKNMKHVFDPKDVMNPNRLVTLHPPERKK
ncbi:FAD-binding oxidoreductase [Chloroflexota bacterium]